MPLTMARIGERHFICKVTGRDRVRRHLAALGFVAGETVTVISTYGANVILAIKDTRVALEKDMASRILV